MIRRLFRTALPCLLATLAGCIKNDIPYPLVELRIADIEGEGFTVSENNTARREITLRLDEQTDIRNVRIDKATYDAVIHSVKLDKEEVLGQMRRSQELVGTFDMYTPIYTTLSTRTTNGRSAPSRPSSGGLPSPARSAPRRSTRKTASPGPAWRPARTSSTSG